MSTVRRVTTGLVLLATSIVGPVPAVRAQHHQHETMKAAPARSDSVYELRAALVDQTGRRVGLDLFRGHPVLISVFYASCRDACPLLIADLQKIEAEVSPAVRADLRVVLVSIDPAHDTPEVLRGLARAHGVDERRWRLLTGSDDVVREIAAVLGVKYRRLRDGTFNHSSAITLLDPSGVAVGRVEGLGAPHQALLHLLAGRAGPGAAAPPAHR